MTLYWTRARVVRLAYALALLAIATPTARADVAVTFDDGPESQYTIARPELLRDHLPATFYIISGELGAAWGPHMTTTEIHQLAADGFEIGSHTVDHPDLTTLTPQAVARELAQSKTTLEQITGKPVVDFAYPYGLTTPIIDTACLAVYHSCRGFGEPGTNNLASLNRGDEQAYGVNATTPLTQIKQWINTGRATGVLVILVYHKLVTPPPTDSASPPARFKRAMRYLARSGARVVTMRDSQP